jgi:hypothetical protein
MRPEEENIVSKIKNMDKRLSELEKGRLVVNLTIPDVGTFRVPTGANNPASGVEGNLFVNTTTHKLMVYVSGGWVAVH